VNAITDCEQLDLEAKEFDPEMVRESIQSGNGIFFSRVKDLAKITLNNQQVRWVQHEEWNRDQIGSINKDGTYLLEIPYSDVSELVGKILKYRSDVSIISLSSLEKLVKDQLSGAINKYSKK
jgi:hypothetical protein